MDLLMELKQFTTLAWPIIIVNVNTFYDIVFL